MTWNFRVVKKPNNHPLTTDEAPYTFGIHEVYYDNNGNVVSCTVEPIAIDSDSLEGISWMIEKIAEGMQKPVLDWDNDIPKSEDESTDNELEIHAEDGC